ALFMGSPSLPLPTPDGSCPGSITAFVRSCKESRSAEAYNAPVPPPENRLPSETNSSRTRDRMRTRNERDSDYGLRRAPDVGLSWCGRESLGTADASGGTEVVSAGGRPTRARAGGGGTGGRQPGRDLLGCRRSPVCRGNDRLSD